MSETKSQFDADMELCQAAQAGDIGGLRAALESGADALDEALAAACAKGDATPIRYLLERGANPNAILPPPNDRGLDEEDPGWADDLGWPIRHLIVDLIRARRRDALIALLAGGLDLRLHAFPSSGALLAAEASRDAELVLKLLRAGAWTEAGPLEPGEGFAGRAILYAEGLLPELVDMLVEKTNAADHEVLLRRRRWLLFAENWSGNARMWASLRRAGYRPDRWESLRWRFRWIWPAALFAPVCAWGAAWTASLLAYAGAIAFWRQRVEAAALAAPPGGRRESSSAA